ncbi:uncharacterized protein EV420DRAFT_102574 [Desarmillaria tabescens]|uniref:DUF6533 domain-containing protein n=1 Tax=Armillaria tabescens TaxID=1929756 RepID=A0AA39NR41_ARMTA|nr:uncharacterized protein EV420DRAFT_102574 [Desarmillaria tabescens]KAK0470275.1 hypothetical protein EV420DRAFT_102574 [Desarmillaria tabescens]
MCVTMDSEIACVWSRKWSLGKALFLVNRYIPPLTIALDFYYAANRMPNNAEVLSFVLSNVISILIVAVTQVILALRTYALYLTDFWLYFLGCLIVLPTFTALFLMLWVYGKYIVVDYDAYSQWVGCMYMQCDSPVCTKTWVFLDCYFIGFDTVIFLLTLWKYRTSYSEKLPTRDADLGRVLADYESSFLRVLFQDGFLFYAVILPSLLAMFALALGNILVVILGPNSLTALFVGPIHALRSTLCSRLFLHLRGHQKPRPVTSLQGSSMIRTMSMELMTISRKTGVRLIRPK